MASPAFRTTLAAVVDSVPPNTSITASITPVSGDFIVISISFRDSTISGATVSTVIFNTTENASLISGATVNNNADSHTFRTEVWQLTGATATTANLVATFSESIEPIRMTVQAYTDVDSIGAVNTNTATSNNWDIDVTTNRVNSIVFATAMFKNGDADPFTPDDTENERADGSTAGSGTSNIGFNDLDVPASTIGTYNLGATASVSAVWGAIGIELRSAISGNPWYFYSQQ